ALPIFGNRQVDAALRDVDEDPVAVADQADGAAGRRFRRGVADGQARSAAGEAAVGEQGAFLAQALGLQVAGRVKHFLHARPALRTFVADDHHIARLDLVAEDTLHCGVLTFVDPGTALEYQDGLIHAGSFHHAAVQRVSAVLYAETAFAALGLFPRADAAFGAVQSQARPAGILAESGLGRYAGRAGLEELNRRRIVGLGDIPPGDGIGHGRAV